MKSVFEKIIEKLENRQYENRHTLHHDEWNVGIDQAIEIVNQEAEEYVPDINVGNNGWIPCSERLPEEPEEGLTDIDECDEYIVMIKDADIPTALNYAGNGEWYRDGNYYNVVAWQPLPEPYKQKGE